MKRKELLLALVAAALPWKTAHAEGPKRERPIRSPDPIIPTPPTLESLQEQVTDLLKRVQTLEATQATQVGFTRSGNDLVLEPAQGNVVIGPRQGGLQVTAASVNVRSASGIQLNAASTLEQKAAIIKLN